MGLYDDSELKIYLRGINSDLDNDPIRLDHAVIFCDIDGPLLDCSTRLVYLQAKDYDKFYGAEMANDTKAMDSASTLGFVAGMLSQYGTDGIKIVFNTTRPQRTRRLTSLVLKDQFPGLMGFVKSCWPFRTDEDFMLMRKDKDYSPSGPIKVENAVEWIKNFYSTLEKDIATNTDYYVVDDDQEVLDAFDKLFEEKMVEAGFDEALPPFLVKIGNKKQLNSSEQNKSPEE